MPYGMNLCRDLTAEQTPDTSYMAHRNKHTETHTLSKELPNR